MTNQFNFVGTVTLEPLSGITKNGVRTSNFTVAVETSGGKMYVEVKAYGSLGSMCNGYVKKKSKVYCEGELIHNFTQSGTYIKVQPICIAKKVEIR